jgi:hypothetical protein
VRALLLALATLLCAAAVPAPAHAVIIGLADQNANMFDDRRFEALDVRYARLAVGWDAMGYDWQRAEIDRWLEGARRAGVRPLVTFMHSRTHRRSLPSPERFQHEFRRFRQRWPWVREFATWNEANFCGEPTCNRPALVAAYHRKLRQACRSCRILAAELLDMPNISSYARAMRRASRTDPRLWGLHNYVEANRFRTGRTERFLRATRGEVWITETGGLVNRRNGSTTTDIPESPSHAARVTRFLFRGVLPVSSRITRLYVYEWSVPTNRETWDSALIDPYGRRRPAYRVLVEELRHLRRRLSAGGLRRRTQ